VSAVEGCIACDLTEGRRQAPGGCVFEDGHVRVEHCVGPLGVGTLIVKPRRHILHAADLSETEAAAVGTALRNASVVIERLLHPDQTYICLWSHTGRAPVHIHWVVQPVTIEQMVEVGTHGPGLQAAMFQGGHLPDEAAAAAFAASARTIWPA
jgi:diadenosine tetraphosphate (Ap4A) HIT family hydrolase